MLRTAIIALAAISAEGLVPQEQGNGAVPEEQDHPVARSLLKFNDGSNGKGKNVMNGLQRRLEMDDSYNGLLDRGRRMLWNVYNGLLGRGSENPRRMTQDRYNGMQGWGN